MNVGKATASSGASYAKNNSDDKIQALEQIKKQLTQELKLVKEAKKGDKAAQVEVEKKVKQLSDQIRNIDVQIATLKSQKQSSSGKTGKVEQALQADKLGKDKFSDDELGLSPESRLFDEYIKSGDRADKPDITYRVVNEDGKRVVKFNRGNTENNKRDETSNDLNE